MWRDLENFVREEAESPLGLVPRKFEVAFGSERSAPELQRGLRARRLLADREDRPDRRRPVQRARDRAGLQVGEDRVLGGEDRVGAAAPDSAVHARAARPRRHGAARRSLPGARRRAPRARPASRRGARRTSPASRSATTSKKTSSGRRPSGRRSTRPASSSGSARGTSSTTRRAASRARRGATCGRSAGWPGLDGGRGNPHAERRAARGDRCAGARLRLRRAPAPERRRVLVERFVRAVCDRGLAIDSVLAITYTERAAGELRSRIRSRLAELDRHDLARQLDGAWISTIHGFCHRLLKAHPFEAAVDPNFRVLDENQARVLAGEAFDVALEEFCASDDPERIRLLATYGARGLRRMLTRVYETLRSAGRELVLEVAERPGLEARIEELREAARAALDETAGVDKADKARASVARALEMLERPPASERLLDLSDVSRAGRPPRAVRRLRGGARRGRAGGARRARRARSWRCSRSCSGASPTRTPPRRRPSRRSTSRTSSSRPATCCATSRRSASARAGASARSSSTSSRTRTASSAS